MISEAVLTLILLSHLFLIRGCFKINENLPLQGGKITTEIRDVGTILDEMADLIHTVSESIPMPSAGSPPMGSPIGDLLSMFLNNSRTTGDEHGPFTELRQVQENNPPTTLETEDQFD
jgi:hypothetical protein